MPSFLLLMKPRKPRRRRRPTPLAALHPSIIRNPMLLKASTKEAIKPHKVTIEYEDATVRMFMIASIIWGAVGMLVGVLVAFQLNFHQLNLGLEWLNFGRLRPLHTNGAIFAFVGNMMFAGVYHSTQRLCKCRTASKTLSLIHFWGWQLIIVGAAITLPMGITQSKEYAELIWPLDIMVAVIWVIFGINFFWTLAKRNEPSLYVAIWFYIATIVTVAMLYVVNNLQLPTSIMHGYSIYAGVQDALVQWWYGHNAVAFFLTTPILGIMYYYMPKAANRPVYSYRLSVVHFWSLVFIYIWAGPHHLLNTALPPWLQALGMLFSLMLWAPSWGGMLNGLLTLRGAWDKLREDPVLKFLAAGVTFYGMATFEGPLLSIKSVNALSHYSDWTIGHVHGGTLGWNGFMAAGMFYWLAPRLWKTKLYSVGMANLHFWLSMVGILLYVASMWVSGITQGLMLNATEADGALLKYPDFVETLNAIRPMMLTRAVGGTLYLIGWFMLIFNIFKTIMGKEPVTEKIDVMVSEDTLYRSSTVRGLINWPLTYSLLLILFSTVWFLADGLLMILSLMASFAVVLIAIVHFQFSGKKWADWYDRFLENSMVFTVVTFLAVVIGGAVQIIPSLTINADKVIMAEGRVQGLYTPLELAGRDIYISEGCYNCHSQMVRTMVPDVLRYGDGERYSKIGDSIYDHPFQWGSKRTGPDLAFEGGKRPDVWHYNHFLDPRSTSPGSNMPAYPWLFKQKLNVNQLPSKINTLRILGNPYPEMDDETIITLAQEQAMEITQRLLRDGAIADPDTKVIALIAYMQKLGSYEQPSFVPGANADSSVAAHE